MAAIFKPPTGAILLRSHPLAHGLVHDWLMNEGRPTAQRIKFADKANQLTYGVFGSGSGTTTGNSWKLSTRGAYIGIDNSGTGSLDSVLMPVGDSGGSGGIAGGVVSFATRILLASIGTTQSIYGGVNQGFYVRVNPTGNVEVLSQLTTVYAISTGTVSANVWTDIGVCCDGATVFIYLGGHLSGSTPAATSFIANSQFSICGGDSPRPVNGSAIDFVRLWKRPLTATEFLLMTYRPYACYRIPSRRSLNAKAAAASTTSYFHTFLGGGGTTSTTALSSLFGLKALRSMITNRLTQRRGLLRALFLDD